MGHKRPGAASPQRQASVLYSAPTSGMPNGVVHDEDKAVEDVVRGPRCRSRNSRAERRGIGRSAGRDVAGRDVAATQRAETRMNGDEMSGKGGTACMHTPEPAIAARCVGGCGAPDFLVEV